MKSFYLEKFLASPHYRCWLNHPIREDVKKAYLTQPIQISSASSWSSAAESPHAGYIQKIVQPLSGRATQAWVSTFQSWEGAQPISISFNFTFVAFKDATSEVMLPIKNLMGWPLSPKRNSTGLIETPLEMHIPGSTAGYIQIKCGSNFLITGLLPVSVDPTFNNVYDKKGVPTKADVSCTFQTVSAMSAEDVASWFNSGGFSTGG